MSTSKLLLTLIAGAAVGAALGVLYAPAKGTVTRKKLAKSGSVCSDDIKDQFSNYVDSITESLAAVKDGVGEFMEAGKEKITSHAKVTK